MIHWNEIDTVLFDMDGTLLDLHFDDFFWKRLVPEKYASKNGITFDEAWAVMEPKLRKIAGTLEWYCFDFWSRELGLDILRMKREITHLIQFRPGAKELLDALHKSSKKVILATNCNRDGLELKMEYLPFGEYFDAIYSSHDFGHPKEDQEFWQHLSTETGFNPERTLFVDDNLQILRSARTYGVGHLLAITKPNSAKPPMDSAEFKAVDDLGDLLPLDSVDVG
ncbi:GMP/IMP nucleotidase [Sansalvadorimonas sp. 2012CJ34-2]|uniref:GMP/IMP nucleotidase n=1 Tax=Parendozoicomonas callyspongiae TaxID=2942213 RepID=A0ABT0PKB9_9GAMM|nr:GMP/IMP nucleotidase [Sansalvadorimonas sp. 2012CJ34-2]MCL6271162.1 GMP/IMP nucleotidase [Sansalvadorimonas sp. 2012CJ34-2]